MLVFMTYNAWLIASVLSGESLRLGGSRPRVLMLPALVLLQVLHLATICSAEISDWADWETTRAWPVTKRRRSSHHCNISYQHHQIQVLQAQ